MDLYKLSIKCCGNNNKKCQITYRKKISFFSEMDNRKRSMASSYDTSGVVDCLSVRLIVDLGSTPGQPFIACDYLLFLPTIYTRIIFHCTMRLQLLWSSTVFTIKFLHLCLNRIFLRKMCPYSECIYQGQLATHTESFNLVLGTNVQYIVPWAYYLPRKIWFISLFYCLVEAEYIIDFSMCPAMSFMMLF